VAAATILLLTFATPAVAANDSFTWDGVSTDWSVAASWGGTAPSASDGVVDLTFPASACMGTFEYTECPVTTDDIPNLTVGTLSLADITDASSSATMPLVPGGGSYEVLGSDALTLDGGIDVPTTALGSGNGVMGLGTTGINVPIVLGAANSWSLGPHVSLSVGGDITGSFPLAISGDSDALIALGAPVEVGLMTISDTVVVVGGFSPSDPPGDLNGVDAQPVTLDDSVLDGNAAVGQLTMDGGELNFGVLTAASINLSGSTQVNDELQPAGAAPDLTSSGAVNLASAELAVSDDGCEPSGTVTTLVQAQGRIVGTFTDSEGNPITNGEIIQPAYGCPTDTADPIEINYTTNAVTATLDSRPPELPAPSPALPAPPTLSPEPSSSVLSVPVAPKISLLGAPRPESQGVSATLECTASAGHVCDVTGTLTSVESRANARLLPVIAAKAKHKPRALVDGSSTTEIPAGATATITVTLDSTARKLLAELHKLRATLTVTLNTGGTPSTAYRNTVTLASPRKNVKH
jgi:hypothetical protein